MAKSKFQCITNKLISVSVKKHFPFNSLFNLENSKKSESTKCVVFRGYETAVNLIFVTAFLRYHASEKCLCLKASAAEP